MTYMYRLSILFICLLKGNETDSKPIISPEDVDVLENTRLVLKCSLSQSETKVKWINNNGFGFIQCFNNNSFEIYGEFLISNNHLYNFFCFGNGNFALEIFSVGKRQNGEFWQCGNNFETSNKVTINVKDDKPHLRVSQRVVWEFDNVTLTCSCPNNSLSISTFYKGSDENKLADMILFSNKTCSINLISSEIKNFNCFDNNNFELTVSLQRKENGYNWTCSCGIIVTVKSDPEIIFVNVPVENTNLQVNNKSISEDTKIQVLNNSIINIECFTTCARPIPNITWHVPVYEKHNISNLTTYRTDDGLFCSHSRLSYQPTLESQDYEIYCSASNKDNERRFSSKNTVDVLYSPSINLMDDKYVQLGNSFQLPCPVVPGNPSHTESIWTSKYGQQISESQILSITNVSKFDDMEYICTVYNIMTPTGLPSVLGRKSGSFHLHVEYEATVDDFRVDRHYQITVNESDTPALICTVDSYPVSKTEIHFGNKQLALKYSNSIGLSLRPVKCLDAGKYICYGGNKHNIVPSQREAFIFVRCSPKAYPGVNLSENLTTPLGVQVVLRFSAIAYPSPSTVAWQKLNDEYWRTLIPDSHIKIQQTDLNYSLTINKVMMPDFGKYKLYIENDVGTFEQIYKIILEEKVVRDSNTSDIGTVIGSSVGAVLFLLGLSFGLYIYRRYKQNVQQNVQQINSSVDQNIMGLSTKDNNGWTEYERNQFDKTTEQPYSAQSTGTITEIIEANPYEQLHNTLKDSNLYSELQHDNASREDTQTNRISDSVSETLNVDNAKAIYINMKI